MKPPKKQIQKCINELRSGQCIFIRRAAEMLGRNYNNVFNAQILCLVEMFYRQDFELDEIADVLQAVYIEGALDG